MRRCARLSWEFFKIALFVVGGGYAIVAVADEVFGRKLKWLREGEIFDNLPIISTVPGLIAGNAAVYTGLKVCGRFGALCALAAVALPSYLIFTAVTVGFASVPQGNPWIDGAFLGLRSALTGVVAGTIWKTLRRGPVDWSKGVGVDLAPLPRWQRLAAVTAFLLALGLAVVFCWQVVACFLGFGCICVGGGFPLVPFYSLVFVGPDAPLVNMSPQDFSNMMALTQMTPGPVGVNAATYFGHVLAGPVGGFVATAALLTPSYFLMTGTLVGLARWRESAVVRGIIACLKPITLTLMGIACWKFASMSVVTLPETGGIVFHPVACVLAVFSALMFVRKMLSIMALIFICAVFGAMQGILL